jgi:hypothetical protein
MFCIRNIKRQSGMTGISKIRIKKIKEPQITNLTFNFTVSRSPKSWGVPLCSSHNFHRTIWHQQQFLGKYKVLKGCNWSCFSSQLNPINHFFFHHLSKSKENENWYQETDIWNLFHGTIWHQQRLVCKYKVLKGCNWTWFPRQLNAIKYFFFIIFWNTNEKRNQKTSSGWHFP